MDGLKSIIQYQTQEYGHIRVKLAEVLDSRGITRNKLRTLTGTKYEVIDRYYKGVSIEMADLDFLAKVCLCLIARCPIFWNISARRCPDFTSENIKSHGEPSFRQELRLTVRFILFPVIQGAPNRDKALQAGDDHIVSSAGAVDNQQIAVFVSAAHDANMRVLWIKHQITRLGLLPGDGGTVSVLGACPSAMADDVFAAGDIVKHPIDKSAAIQPVGPVGAGGGVACGGDFPECAPAGVPADHQGFNSDR